MREQVAQTFDLQKVCGFFLARIISPNTTLQNIEIPDECTPLTARAVIPKYRRVSKNENLRYSLPRGDHEHNVYLHL